MSKKNDELEESEDDIKKEELEEKKIESKYFNSFKNTKSKLKSKKIKNLLKKNKISIKNKKYFKKSINSFKKNKISIKNKISRKNKKYFKKNKIFSSKDYNSNDGFLTTIWGPAQWHMLHTISFNYPVNPTEEQKNNYRNYILSLQNILPCGACRKNLINNLKNYPLTMNHMKNRNTFSRYIYNLHEIVNEMLEKKSGLSYCDVRERYEHFRARCVDKKPKVYTKFSKTLKNRKEKNENNHEKGCTEPLYGEKARCILNIVPQEQKGESLQIDKKCMKTRGDKNE
jgi:hypothetical protein